MDTELSGQEEIIQVESIAPDDGDGEGDADAAAAPQANKDAEQAVPEGTRDGNPPRDREPGKSILPFSRVQKIMKADKDLPMVARDATFLISLATEEFIKRLSQACQRLAEREKRTTVQQKDVASIVRRVEEFLFLEEIVGSQESTGKRRPQKIKTDAGALDDPDQMQPTLRDFIQKPSENDANESNNVVMDEDGAMYTG